MCVFIRFKIEELYIINLITMTRKSQALRVIYGTLDSCVNHIRFHQQCIR